MIIDTETYWSCLFLIIFSGIVNIFLIILIFYQLYFISQDITTSEYLRMDIYKANLFDDNFKLNWKKFLLDEDNYEKDLIYNDNAKQIMHKTYMIQDFYKLLKTIKDNNIQDIEKISENKKDFKENEKTTDISSYQNNISIEYFKSKDQIKISNLLEN
jgi:hypothetical protein